MRPNAERKDAMKTPTMNKRLKITLGAVAVLFAACVWLMEKGTGTRE